MRPSPANIEKVLLAYGDYLRKTGDFERVATQAYPLIEDEDGPVRVPIEQRERALATIYAKHLATIFGGAEIEVAMHEDERGGVFCIVKAAAYDPEHGSTRQVRDRLWTRFMESNEPPSPRTDAPP